MIAPDLAVAVKVDGGPDVGYRSQAIVSAMGFDTRRRSFAKSISWRILAGFITTGVALALTGEMGFAAKIGLVDTTTKLLIYFLHERAWNKIPYGRVEKPDYEV